MKTFLSLLIIACLLAGCAINQITGRNQLSLVSESELQLMATNQYKTFLSENKVLNSIPARMLLWWIVSECE